MNKYLPDGRTRLEPDWVLQHPADYLEVLVETIPAVLKESGVGDHFQWFVENCIPLSYTEEAKSRDISIHKLLREKAGALKVGESGLIALEWWNGNRSVLVDVDLTGLILGCTLLTKLEEMYRSGFRTVGGRSPSVRPCSVP